MGAVKEGKNTMIGGRPASQVERDLWNPRFSEKISLLPAQEYDGTVLAQWRELLRLSDSWSRNREAMQARFLWINVLVSAALFGALALPGAPHMVVWGAVHLTLFGLLFLWLDLLASLQVLQSSKFEVIEAVEEALPARAMVKAEWSAMMRKDYTSLSKLGRFHAALFLWAYAATFLIGAWERWG